MNLPGNLYSVEFEAGSVSAIQDLLSYLVGTKGMSWIERIIVSNADPTPPSAQNLQMSLRFYGATVTPGSGGSAVTLNSADGGRVAALGTARKGDTTQATTSGTTTIPYPIACYLYTGLDFTLPTPFPLLEGQLCTLSLDAAPPAPCKLSCVMIVREMGSLP